MIRRAIATAVAAVLLLAGCDDAPDDADPSPSAATGNGSSESTSPSPTGDPGPLVTCPDEILLDPDPALPDEVPEGATSARLCAGGGDQVAAPADALTTGVESLASAVNEQRLVAHRHCVDRQLPAYQLAFGYPDGSSFVVSGRFTGCAELLVGSARRARAMPPLHAFVQRLVGQRSTATPPDQAIDPDSLDCAQPRAERSYPLGDPAGLAVAVLCVGRPERPGRAARVPIPADQLATLAASTEVDVGPTEVTFGCRFLPRVPWIVGVTAWGDPVTLTNTCYGFGVTEDLEWQPRGEARRIMRALVAQTG